KQLLISQEFTFLIYDTDFNQVDRIFSYHSLAFSSPRKSIKIGDDFWVADNGAGLARFTDNFHADLYRINSPETERVFDTEVLDGKFWFVAGSYSNNYNPTFFTPIVGQLFEGEWTNYTNQNHEKLIGVADIITIAVDPNDANHVFAGSWGAGLVEIKNGKVSFVYDSSNLAEHSLSPRPETPSVFVGGLDFDESSNLWISNSYSSRLLSVLTAEGEWKSFNFLGQFDQEADIAELLADSYNNIWMLQHRDNKIVIYNHAGTPLDLSDDPNVKVLTSGDGQGNLPGDQIFSIVEDHNGEVWVGTNEGVAVFYNPSLIFDGNGNFDAQQILIQQDGSTQILFETESVSALAIDGANRKWIGTKNAGVFLMSEDGTKEILHFTTDNSPLYSNLIRSISVDDESGEIYIGTDKGIISYKGTATEGDNSYKDAYVYPNPVREDYTGLITITGLATDVNVKITDVSGRLVYETTAFGGQAIWNGKNFGNQKVKTGVYLIFCTDEAGEYKNVLKLLFIN
ncbi:MAG: T9SS type A sorting domain-containing protein, partial [Draconibacterium sp.]|nr:T9SS type A sorting domain-containing protein [Draconibacterium sp.]